MKVAMIAVLTVSGMLLTGSAFAEPSKEAAQERKNNWQSMNQEEKQAKAQDAQEKASAKHTQWQSLSEEEKQAKRAGARVVMQEKRGAREKS